MTPFRDDRGRLVEAMGLGPLWVQRTTPRVVDVAAPVADPSEVSGLDWDTLARMVASGRACGLTTVRPDAAGARCEWLVVGDALAGPSGRLLDAMLAAIGLAGRGEVCVARFVPCPANAGHLSAAGGVTPCRSCLDRQIELLAPRMILLFGDVATAALFPDAGPFDGFRGKPHRLSIGGRDTPVIATFHPARLLEDGAAKAMAWADLCRARAMHDELSAAVLA